MMKKKGVLFVLLIVLIVAIVLVTVFFMLFSLKTFQVESTTENMTEVDIAKVVGTINQYKGTNAFAFNGENFEVEIEKQFPYIDVTRVELVFPSKVIVTFSERVALFAINYNSEYYVFDSIGTLVDIRDNLDSSGGEYGPIEVRGVTITAEDNLIDKVGEKITLTNSQERFEDVLNFMDVMMRIDYDNNSYDAYQLKAFLDEITFDLDNNLLFEARYGTNFVVYDYNDNFDLKLRYILGAFNSEYSTDPNITLTIKNDLTVIGNTN